MLQVRVHGPGDVRVDEVDPPAPGPRDVVVRVAACGICATDLSYIKMGGMYGPTGTPMPIGHEVAGTVEVVGHEVGSVRAGDRVVVQPGDDELGRIGNGSDEGGFAELLLVTEADRHRLYPVPEGLPLDVAAFGEPMGVGLHAVEQAEVSPTDGVAVFGCGPIGLAAVAALADRGQERVVAVEPDPLRRELALGLGAHLALDPTGDDVWDELARLHGTAPFMLGPTAATAAFIEASGSSRVLTEILDRGPVGGRMVVVAVHYDPVPTSYLMLMMKEFTIRGSIEYPPRFADGIDVLGRRDLSSVITHRFPLERFPEALATVQAGGGCGKVVVCAPGEA